MIDTDNVTIQFTEKGEWIEYYIAFASVKIQGLLALEEAVQLRSELVKAINEAKKKL